MKKKRIVALVFSAFLTLGAGASVYAQSQNTGDFSYKTLIASGVLNVDWNIIDADTAKAYTKFNNGKAASDYRVAVRLEEYNQPWSSTPEATRYQGDSKWAEVNMQVNNVWMYASRHAIENSGGTKEYVDRVLTDR